MKGIGLLSRRSLRRHSDRCPWLASRRRACARATRSSLRRQPCGHRLQSGQSVPADCEGTDPAERPTLELLLGDLGLAAGLVEVVANTAEGSGTEGQRGAGLGHGDGWDGDAVHGTCVACRDLALRVPRRLDWTPDWIVLTYPPTLSASLPMTYAGQRQGLLDRLGASYLP